jgi:hypothetical protein
MLRYVSTECVMEVQFTIIQLDWGLCLRRTYVATRECVAFENHASLTGYQKTRALQRGADVRELVITGLSHLVSANTECGFKHCLPLAYDEEIRKQTIFAHVFSRVLGQGTKFDPQEDNSAAAIRRQRLSEVCEIACPRFQTC